MNADSGTASQEAGAEARQPLATVVADWIRKEIIEGRLRPGDRIRQEAVAKECGTSRIPVREALNRLQDEGLISLTSHVGARVATLDAAELEEIYLLRERLEPLALAKSIPNLKSAEVEGLWPLIEEMEAEANGEDPSHWVEIDRKFHLATYAGASMPYLLELITGFWNRTQQYRRAYTRLPESFRIAHMEHRLLMEAIERKDTVGAEQVSRTHIRRTRLALEHHAELFSDDG
jgi:DNA-binding GntR family transcriptional regulator